MNKYKFKGLGLVILSIVLMTTLLSCSNINSDKNIDHEIAQLNINEALEQMEAEIIKSSINIQAEQNYFKDNTTTLDYDNFAKTLDKDFESINNDFAKAHSIVLDGLDELKMAEFKGDDINKIVSIEDQQYKLSVLFQDLYYYHFMILETNVILALFTQEVSDLMVFMSDGNITTFDYNIELEKIMDQYSQLLMMDDETIDNEFLRDPKQIEETLITLSKAKVEILGIITNSDVDEQVNDQVYNLFDYIETSIKVVEEYTSSIQSDVYIGDINLQIDEGAYEYVNKILDTLP